MVALPQAYDCQAAPRTRRVQAAIYDSDSARPGGGKVFPDSSAAAEVLMADLVRA
jgi:hypothetical protein